MEILTKLIVNSKASSEVLEEIAHLKSVRWPYPLEKQLNWMKENLQADDVHLLVYVNDALIAYTNFVNIEVEVDEKRILFMGIGNVSTKESGKGYGEILMNTINDSIKLNNWKGILFCKKELVGYYNKFGWDLIDSSVIVSDFLKNINTMFYNFNSPYSSIKYLDRNF